MKKKILFLFFVIAVSILAFGAFDASAATYGGLTYTVSNGKATITDCNTSASGELVIPSKLGGYPVTSIGSYAFEYCSSLTSVTIGDSVTSIGDYAFFDCSRLTSVNITDISSWCKIAFGNYDSNPLYYAKNLYLNGELVTNLVIPDSVTSIGKLAFSGCSSLTSVSIPDGVTSIGSYAFSGCSSLTSVSIPDGVTSTGNYAFEYCSKLTSVSIPDSVTSIGYYAFRNCSSLTSVSIPDSVTSIGNGAFYGCSRLTSVTIGDSVTSIGERAFYYCSRLTSVIIPDSVTSIGDGAFEYCSSLTSVSIPDSVMGIGNSAFYNCYNLENVYYMGTKDKWNNINIGSYNTNLTNKVKFYAYVTLVSEDGKKTVISEVDKPFDMTLIP